MSRTANCYDNAVTESFFHSFKGECIDRESFQASAEEFERVPSSILKPFIIAFVDIPLYTI